MVPDSDIVDLSRLQFALTAMYHFLFVPLTLGLAFILAIMESVYVMTDKIIYKDMTRFWGKLFGINFALGVTTGLTLEFQFGTNWSYYSHYVGDVFGAPLAIEGLMAFFLESTLVGIFFFGWDRMSKVRHLAVTWALAFGSNMSALWILIANGWMQNPVGAEFNYQTMRMELSSFLALLFNPVAQVKFVHTVGAGYVTGAMFVLGISSFYLLQHRDVQFARRSYAIAAAFGLASVLSVIILGDESGYTIGDLQKVKLAAIEAEWETEMPPASFTLFGLPDQEHMQTKYAVKIPGLLGLIATRSISEPVIGLRELIEKHKTRIKTGIEAYQALQKLKAGDQSPETLASFQHHQGDLGFALLLKRYSSDITKATPEQIEQAAYATIPRVAVLFWAFRLMVLAGIAMLSIFVVSFYYCARRDFHEHRWLLRAALYGIPLPWVAAELGWVVAEYGRQPWTISGILPTALSSSSLSLEQLYLSLGGFVGFYTVLLAVELFLMFKYARLGPSSLHTGRYHHEVAASR